MKRHIVIAALAFASCTGNGDKQNGTGDTANTVVDTAQTKVVPVQDAPYCFVNTEGNTNQDSTTVNFTVKGSAVTGQMIWLPKEKDRRKGSLHGTVDGDLITAVWSFMQEGMKDSITLSFKLQPHTLMQKPLKTNTSTGREETDEAADYSVVYKEAACRN